MARRKDHTREELTQLAIEAGTSLVTQRGPDALTARNVAQEIGYTAGTLYNIFENIDALAAAINIQSMERFSNKIHAIIQNNADAPTRLHKISQAYLDFNQSEPQLWSLLFATPIEHKSEAYSYAVHQIFDQVTEVMQPLSENPTEARQKAKVLWATLHGVCLLDQSRKLNVGEEDSPETLINSYLDQLLNTHRL